MSFQYCSYRVYLWVLTNILDTIYSIYIIVCLLMTISKLALNAIIDKIQFHFKIQYQFYNISSNSEPNIHHVGISCSTTYMEIFIYKFNCNTFTKFLNTMHLSFFCLKLFHRFNIFKTLYI